MPPSFNIARMSSASVITGRRVRVLRNADRALLFPIPVLYRHHVGIVISMSVLDDLLTSSTPLHRRPDVPMPHLHGLHRPSLQPIRSFDKHMRISQMCNKPVVNIAVTSATNIDDFGSHFGRYHECHCPTCPGRPQYINVFFALSIPVSSRRIARKYARRFCP